MIQWVLSKSGHDIPLVNGQALASRYDPVKEAVRFLETRGPQLEGAECVFLVGGGNPYLVQELLKMPNLAAIVAIDADSSLVSELSRRFQHDLVSWICPEDFSDGSAFRGVEKFFRLPFSLLVAPAAQALDALWVRNCVSFLNGHSVAGFHFQMALRFPNQLKGAIGLVPECERNFGKMKALELMRSGAATDQVTAILSEIVR